MSGEEKYLKRELNIGEIIESRDMCDAFHLHGCECADPWLRFENFLN